MLVYYSHIYKLYLVKRLKIDKFYLLTFSSGSQKMQYELWAYNSALFSSHMLIYVQMRSALKRNVIQARQRRQKSNKLHWLAVDWGARIKNAKPCFAAVVGEVSSLRTSLSRNHLKIGWYHVRQVLFSYLIIQP
jgi:hypothetical protein